MKQLLTIALMAAVFGGSALDPQLAQAGPNCTCRHSGGDVLEGQTACIKTPLGMGMARCERVLNNTSWTMLDVPCPLANAEVLGPPHALQSDIADDRQLQSPRVLSGFGLMTTEG